MPPRSGGEGSGGVRADPRLDLPHRRQEALVLLLVLPEVVEEVPAGCLLGSPAAISRPSAPTVPVPRRGGLIISSTTYDSSSIGNELLLSWDFPEMVGSARLSVIPENSLTFANVIWSSWRRARFQREDHLDRSRSPRPRPESGDVRNALVLHYFSIDG